MLGVMRPTLDGCRYRVRAGPSSSTAGSKVERLALFSQRSTSYSTVTLRSGDVVIPETLIRWLPWIGSMVERTVYSSVDGVILTFVMS